MWRVSGCVAVLVVSCGKEASKEPGPASSGTAKPAAVTRPASGHTLEVESGKIVFDDRRVEEATMTVWFADHGNTVVVKRDITKPVAKTVVNVWNDGKNAFWEVGGTSRRVTVTRLRAKSTELEAFPPRQLEMAGYVHAGDEAVAGANAAVWKNEKMKTTAWVWKGIEVKREIQMKDKLYTIGATSIEEGGAPPAELLSYPDGYEVKDLAK